jgi:hypothetical protein
VAYLLELLNKAICILIVSSQEFGQLPQIMCLELKLLPWMRRQTDAGRAPYLCRVEPVAQACLLLHLNHVLLVTCSYHIVWYICMLKATICKSFPPSHVQKKGITDDLHLSKHALVQHYKNNNYSKERHKRKRHE